MIDRDLIALQEALAGEYSIERELGRGGMGIVYLAREVQLDRLIAIKVLPAPLARDPAIRERFLREARLAASLSHPHVVPIHRVGEANGFVFFVMAYVNGETLGQRLRTRGPLSPAAATRLMREVSWALSYAHGRGIVHRDVKPDNILIEADTGRAMVSDFGIALGASDTQRSDPGRVMGSAHFMSPEQAASAPLDGRSDLYSLGVVAYLSLTGRLPFEASSVPALLAKHATEVPMPVAASAPAVPHSLATVVDRLLAKNPADRYANGEALAEAIETAAAPPRARLPIALRLWVQSEIPFRGLYMGWTGVFTLGFLSQVRGGVGDLFPIAFFGALPVIPFAVFHLRKTYGALAAGYTLRDLRAALASRQQERLDELAFEFAQDEPRWAKALRAITYGTVALLATVFFGVHIAEYSLAARLLYWGSLFLGAGSVAVSSALGVRLIPKSLTSRLKGSVRAWFWNSRAGEIAANLIAPKNRKAVVDVQYRPTEMALSVAVDDLFRALPASYRERVADLPAVAATLEAHAAAARARIQELDALAAAGGRSSTSDAAALGASRDRARKQLADAVAALESVRLDLLRLHGGATDLESITTVLDAAREIGSELDRLNRAQADVARIISPLDLRPHTPV